MPEVPVPEVPEPEVLEPEVPEPEVPELEVPEPEVPEPEVPQSPRPEVPVLPEVPELEVPEAPLPDVPMVPEFEVPVMLLPLALPSPEPLEVALDDEPPVLLESVPVELHAARLIAIRAPMRTPWYFFMIFSLCGG